MCCISVTLTTRLIGLFDLSASIVGIFFLAQEFFSDEQRLIDFNDIKIFMGLSWSKSSTHFDRKLDNTWIFGLLLAYSTLYFFCSAGLILATFSRNKHHAVPWLTFEIISFGNQGSGIITHFLRPQCVCDVEIFNSESVLAAGFYLVLTAYFWIVVFIARSTWEDAELSDTVVSVSETETSPVATQKVSINPPKSLSLQGRIQSLNSFQFLKTTRGSPKYYKL
ncbi:uncharacterized protein LOC124408078 [Diprion similis]|uniref:uncharacterized protein LOC124408078 n=1 Tax=Diprion similis TaxID=362088 RepID=UPI001EF80724|nr:uncharacterized protein LOC124408078 [Diprion similis]